MSEHQSQSGEAVRCSAVVRHQDQEYQPEMWTVRKDDIYAAISAVESGIEYAQMCLSEHDKSLGRTTLKNKTWAEHMESDLRQMANAHKALRLMPNAQAQRPPPETPGRLQESRTNYLNRPTAQRGGGSLQRSG